MIKFTLIFINLHKILDKNIKMVLDTLAIWDIIVHEKQGYISAPGF